MFNGGWRKHSAELISPLFFVTHSKWMGRARRSVDEQWTVATKIAKTAMRQEGQVPQITDIFRADVFFMAILRQKMIVSCSSVNIESNWIRSIYRGFIAFGRFMCAQYWWQGIRLCPNRDIADMFPSSSGGGEYKNYTHFCSEVKEHIQSSETVSGPQMQSLAHTEAAVEEVRGIPAIITLEPPRFADGETVESYIESMSDLLPTTLAEEDFSNLILLFGNSLSSNHSMAPLLSVPPRAAVTVADFLLKSGREFEVLAFGSTDVRIWKKDPLRSTVIRMSSRSSKMMQMTAGGNDKWGGCYFLGKMGRDVLQPIVTVASIASLSPTVPTPTQLRMDQPITPVMEVCKGLYPRTTSSDSVDETRISRIQCLGARASDNSPPHSFPQHHQQ